MFNSKVINLVLSFSGDGQIAKLSRSKPLFSSTGKVVEISDGSVERFSVLLQKNKISFVLIYAPWCGQSLAVAHEFNRTAKTLYKEVHSIPITFIYILTVMNCNECFVSAKSEPNFSFFL